MNRSIASRGQWIAALLFVVPIGISNFARAGEPLRTLNVEDHKPHPVPDTKPAEIKASLARGVAFLLHDQNKDGSFGNAERSKDMNSYTPVPEGHNGLRAATTALCVQALWETSDRSPEAMAAIDRAEQWLKKNLPLLRRSSADVLYNNWGHYYAIQALATMYGAKPNDTERQKWIRELTAQQIEMLQRFEAVDGGWGYYDFTFHTEQPAALTTSFMSGATLIALYQAQQIGVEVPRKMVDRAVGSILRQQKSDLSYLYGEYLRWRPMHPVNQPEGSLGRTQCCNLALRLWGDKRMTDDIFVACLDRLFAHYIWLDMGRKRPIPHESYFAVAAYFFYFGNYYAALCIEMLPPEQRSPQQQQLAYHLMRASRKRWLLVGLSDVQLPAAIWHSVRADVASPLLARPPGDPIACLGGKSGQKFRRSGSEEVNRRPVGAPSGESGIRRRFHQLNRFGGFLLTDIKSDSRGRFLTFRGGQSYCGNATPRSRIEPGSSRRTVAGGHSPAIALAARRGPGSGGWARGSGLAMTSLIGVAAVLGMIRQGLPPEAIPQRLHASIDIQFFIVAASALISLRPAGYRHGGGRRRGGCRGIMPPGPR